MIKITKIPAYELAPSGQDTYEYLACLTLGQVNPGSLHPGSFVPEAKKVFHSTLSRATESIAKNPNIKSIPSHALNEIPFDLANHVSKKTWEKEGSVAVRREFKSAFIADTLPISRKEIFLQTLDIIRCVVKACRETGSVELLSHSFRMKVLEAFIRSEGRLRDNPALIHEYMLDGVRTYPFLGGFSVEIGDLEKML